MKKILAIIWSITIIYMFFITTDNSIKSNARKKMHEEIQMQYIAEEEVAEEEELTSSIMPRYKSLLEINDEIIGWIKIPNTKIDYPIVKGEDNDFYLNSNIYKKPSKAGSIFMDFRNEGKGAEPHTIIYGHYMRDGSMFKDLIEYKEPKFLLENRFIQFNTLYEAMEWEIFSAYVTDIGFDYLITYFPTHEDYRSFLDSIISRSYINLDTEVSIDDEILTLSTCTYEFKNARFVVHARRLNNNIKKEEVQNVKDCCLW